MPEALPKNFKPKGRAPEFVMDWEGIVKGSPDGCVLRPERDFPEELNVGNLVNKGKEYFGVYDKDEDKIVPGDYIVGVYQKVNIYVMPNK